MSNIFQERITLLQEAQGLTGPELIARTGLVPSTLSLIKGGQRVNPMASTIVPFAEALSTSADYLLGLTDDPTPPDQRNIDPQLQGVIGAWHKLDSGAREQVVNFVAFLARRQRK